MLVLVALGAVFWRSRRVGPLVVENLPVVVRASETMEGRARLYERSNSRLHALDALRVGTVARLARTCGLPAHRDRRRGGGCRGGPDRTRPRAPSPTS